MYKTTAVLTLFLCGVTLIHAESRCCQGENLVNSTKQCIQGEMKKLACNKSYMIKANYSEIRIDYGDNLVFLDFDEQIPPDQYCMTKSEKSNEDLILLCFDEEEDQREVDIRTLNLVLSFISVVFIIITICVYLLVPQLLDTQGICLMQSLTGLALSFICLGIINIVVHIPYHHCRLLAFLTYFSFLYAFFWLNIVCFHIWRTIVNPRFLRFLKNWKIIYHIFGIGGPLILLMFLLLANYSGHHFFTNVHPGIGENKCWFKDSTTPMIYFYGPISVLLGINIVYFVWTSVVLCREMKRCSEKKAKVQKYRLLLCIKLFFVMGIMWCFEVISAVLENKTPKWIWVITDCINALQGLLIFLILVVFRKKVLRALANKRIFNSVRFPASWKNAQDDECEELEEELSLSGVHEKKPEIFA